MNDQLTAAVTALITRAVSTAEAASEFVLAEIPDVIQQLLVWKALVSGLSLLLFVFINVVLVYVWMKHTGQGEPDGKPEYGEQAYKPTLTHTKRGELSGDQMGACVIITVATHSASWIAFDLDWLQILVAPKVYLIEYASQLMK